MPREPMPIAAAKKPAVKKTTKKPVAKKPAAKKPAARVASRESSRARQKDLDNVADRFGGFRPAREVLRLVRAVPTWFVQYDHAGGVGGLPIERFMLLHGPSNHGKTIYALGLIGSFLARNHYAALIDAEFTTPLDWVEHLLGAHADSDRFFAMRPTSYEATVDAVRDFCREIARLRSDSKIAPDTSALIVVDSIRKLVPQNLMKKLVEGAEKHGVDGYGGRAAQIRAAMNAAWMDELVPLLASTQTAMLVIAREAEDPDADARDKAAGRAFKVGGGKSLYYEASQAIRVERAGWVYERKAEKGEERLPAIGERHRITIHKTKVAQKTDRVQVAYFHTSNGSMFPEGFDRPRDLLELGRRLGVVDESGSWITFVGKKVQGELKALKLLHESPDLVVALEREVRAAFEKAPPIEHDADGVVES